MSSKPWEYLSRDEKLDYIRERLEHIETSLDVLAKYVREQNTPKPPAPPPPKPAHGDDTH